MTQVVSPIFYAVRKSGKMQWINNCIKFSFKFHKEVLRILLDYYDCRLQYSVYMFWIENKLVWLERQWEEYTTSFLHQFIKWLSSGPLSKHFDIALFDPWIQFFEEVSRIFGNIFVKHVVNDNYNIPPKTYFFPSE